MNLVERVDVLVAIILGLAMAELGTSFHRLIRAGKRVRWDWMSLALAYAMLLEIVQFWWLSQAWYANATELRLIEFLPRFLIFLLIYLMAAAVLPDKIPENGIDLRAFYVESSRYFWALVVLAHAHHHDLPDPGDCTIRLSGRPREARVAGRDPFGGGHFRPFDSEHPCSTGRGPVSRAGDQLGLRRLRSSVPLKRPSLATLGHSLRQKSRALAALAFSKCRRTLNSRETTL